MIKKLLPILVFMLSSGILYSQAPTRISYQAIIRNISNALVANTDVCLQISIIQGDIEGQAIYVERHYPRTSKNALVTVEIGGGSVLSGNIESIDWSAGPYFIKTEVDVNGGTNFYISGVSQLLSVPYALHANTTSSYDETDPMVSQWAKEAEKPSYSYSEINETPTNISEFSNDVGFVTSNQAVLLSGNQTINGIKTFKTKVVIPEPVSPTDAATKKYVDAVKTQVQTLSNSIDVIKREIEDKMIDEGSYSVTDGFGNYYKVVRIGTQVWMAENLKTTRYNDGSPIQKTSDNTIWKNSNSGLYTYFNDNYNDYGYKYGVLYNFYAISDSRGLCPTGWHVPSREDFSILTNYIIDQGYAIELVGENGVSKALASSTGWATSSNPSAVGNDMSLNNVTGFSALPGGFRVA